MPMEMMFWQRFRSSSSLRIFDKDETRLKMNLVEEDLQLQEFMKMSPESEALGF